MKITILAVGTKMPTWINLAYTDYQKRLGRDISLQLIEIRPEKRGGGIDAVKGMVAEEARILAAIPPRSQVVILDEHGENWTSMQLAKMLAKWQEASEDICFVIGGADGMTTTVKSRADKKIQLSAMTLPHGMVRVLLAEQLYRAYAILNGHPYHRE
ncbi:MAG: 23S rRNA (pseudouridine(1915)-N(3))-methyltransferase RlmH [Neisseriaceae bacterium]|nr:23S rRNA (pseudouridine(1915)-N(3))-methyltransferase RlmH [Neisseriaceae bacterium]